jgi:hypothetical protein
MPESACGPRIDELSGRLCGLQARQEESSADEPGEREPLGEDDLELLQAQVREVVEGGDRRCARRCCNRWSMRSGS